jgi:hypothetical protein
MSATRQRFETLVLERDILKFTIGSASSVILKSDNLVQEYQFKLFVELCDDVPAAVSKVLQVSFFFPTPFYPTSVVCNLPPFYCR